MCANARFESANIRSRGNEQPSISPYDSLQCTCKTHLAFSAYQCKTTIHLIKYITWDSNWSKTKVVRESYMGWGMVVERRLQDKTTTKENGPLIITKLSKTQYDKISNQISQHRNLDGCRQDQIC